MDNADIMNTGYSYIKQFDKYLDFLESEICHEMLPEPIQAVAVRGLMTITGLDLTGWRDLQKEIESMLESEANESLDGVADCADEWKQYFESLLKYIEIIPDESQRFYDEEVKDDVLPLCEKGDTLIKKFILWMDSVKNIMK